MAIRTWLRHPIREYKKWKARKRIRAVSEETKRTLPLREFVYLDAVSLHSLLVSQNATIPNEVTQAISRADEVESMGTLKTKAGSDALGGSIATETTGRFQTSNSNSMQSSRKAVVQTLFKELRELPLDFKLATREVEPETLKDVASIAKTIDRSVVEPATGFTRGTLIEVDVILAVDPVFKLGTMMTEWAAMADDFPGMFGNQGILGFLRDAQPIMKVLDRFLAGLIPIKATAINYVVVEISNKEYVVHKIAVEGLELKSRPLYIVGVTEHLGYWKDIRRVLFSEARFTVLCRVARDGLHKNWTPVKLADLFSEVAPDFVDQINAIRSPSAADPDNEPQLYQQNALSEALTAYKDCLVPDEVEWTEDAATAFEVLKNMLATGSAEASAQRRAFDQIGAFVTQTLKIDPPDSEADLKARQYARAKARLELFPSSGIGLSSQTENSPAKVEIKDERIIDTEVIAIYW